DGDERVVLTLRVLHPDDVVEEQPVAVGRGKPSEAQLRAVHDDLAQRAHLRVDAEQLVGHDSLPPERVSAWRFISFRQGPSGITLPPSHVAVTPSAGWRGGGGRPACPGGRCRCRISATGCRKGSRARIRRSRWPRGWRSAI